MQLRNKIKSIGGNLELFFIFKFDWFIVIKFNSNKSTSFVAFYHRCSSKEDSFRTSVFLAEIIWQLWCILLRGRDLIYSKWEAEVVFRSISLSFVFFLFLSSIYYFVLSILHKKPMCNAYPCCNQPVGSHWWFSAVTCCWQHLHYQCFTCWSPGLYFSAFVWCLKSQKANWVQVEVSHANYVCHCNREFWENVASIDMVQNQSSIK